MEWTQWNTIYKRLQEVTPMETMLVILTQILSDEQQNAEARLKNTYEGRDGADRWLDEEATEKGRTLLTRVVNRWTTLPEPTLEQWKTATESDHDLKLIMTALKNDKPLNKAELRDKRWYNEWKEGKLETENDIIYQYKQPKVTRI